METFKPINPFRGRAALFATVSLIIPLLIVPLQGGEAQGENNLADIEHSRRSAAIEEAQELLRSGDEAYQSGRYSDAVEAYAGARDLIPDAPISAELRAATTERYALASVEYARILSRKGDVAGAKAAVDKILSPAVDPENADALAFRGQLDDPIRTNPVLTAEHAKNVDAVRRLLYTAEGAYSLGKYDQAKSEYEKVLRIDATNSAARRGMEQVASAKSAYDQSASDHARAEMLSQVDAAWETQVPTADLAPELTDPGAGSSDRDVVFVKAKIDRIIIPKLAMDQVSLEEALDFLRMRATENDTMELDPAKKGVNFTVNLGSPDSPVAQKIRSQRFDLKISQVPISQVLKYITDATQTSFTTDDFSVIVTPAGSSSAELVSRTYRVPPDFISNLTSGEAGEAKSNDPFAEKPAQSGLLAKRMGAKEALMKQGVNFPEGSNASYTPSNNILRVVNTAVNQDYIAQIVQTVTQTEPVMVAVRVTMITVQQTRLEELGFDWLLSPVPLNAGETVFGSGGTIGNTGGRTGADFISPINGTPVPGVPVSPNGQVTNGVMTNGNRSGTTAISPNSIDNLISNQDGFSQSASVAPGILAVTGLFSDGQVQAIMRGLNQKKGVDLMIKPSVTARSGQASSIESVREFIYPTEYEPPQLPNSVGTSGSGTTPVTPATPTAFQKRDIGVNLEVLPVADADKQYIDITVKPTFTNFDGFVNYGSPINATQTDILGNQSNLVVTPNRILMPIFSKQSVSTNVRVADGATIAIGGLMTESVQKVEDRVPILGSIPIIGRLFQSTAKQPTSTAILFLVNVELMDPTGRPYRNR
ncbi:MAG: Amuc_1098 family type IV pilus outer membrane protein [Luteolibacter sp.]